MNHMEIKIKRSYDEPDESDGYRILVDRLWPRGLTKEEVKIDLWLKDIAPSDRLRKWFGHDVLRWGEFECSYFAELDQRPLLVMEVMAKAGYGPVTLLFSAKDESHNNAVGLKHYIETKGRKLLMEAA